MCHQVTLLKYVIQWFTELCDCCHCRIPEHFPHGRPWTHEQSLMLSPSPRPPLIESLSLDSHLSVPFPPPSRAAGVHVSIVVCQPLSHRLLIHPCAGTVMAMPTLRGEQAGPEPERSGDSPAGLGAALKPVPHVTCPPPPEPPAAGAGTSHRGTSEGRGLLFTSWGVRRG